MTLESRVEMDEDEGLRRDSKESCENDLLGMEEQIDGMVIQTNEMVEASPAHAITNNMENTASENVDEEQ